MTVKSLLIKISADVSEFNKNIDSSKKKFADLSAGMTRVGMGLTAAVTLPLLAVGAASIKMAMSAVESENLFEVSMGEMAGAARTWSEDLRKQLGLNEYEIRKNVGVMYSMTTSMGLTADAAYGVSTGMTQLAYDCASFYNLDPETAFNKLRSGISGEIEPLKQLGILVDETTVKHYAWKNGIAAQGEELTQQQKVLARYGVIMEATKNAQGDMARTLDSPTNKLRVMQEQMKMTATELGMQLLPAFNALLSVGSKLVSGIGSVVKTFSSLPGPIKTIILVLAGLAAAAGPVLIVLAKLLPLMNSLALAAPRLGRAFLALATNPMIALAAALAVTGALVNKQIENLKKFHDAEMDAIVSSTKLSDATQFRNFLLDKNIVTQKELTDLVREWGMTTEGVLGAAKAANDVHQEGTGIMARLGRAYADYQIAVEGAKKKKEEEIATQQKAAASLESMKQLRADLTAEINKASMSEAQYTKWSLDQQYAARVLDIQRSAMTAAQKNALLLQARQAYNAQVAALDKAAGDTLLAQAAENNQVWLEGQAEAQAQYLALKQGLHDSLHLMTMTELAEKILAMEQERLIDSTAMAEKKSLTEAQHAELLAIIKTFYADKKAEAEGSAQELTELEAATVQTVGGIYQDFFNSTLEGFQQWGEGQGSLLETLGKSYKDMAKTAISAIKSLLSSYLAAAAKEVVAAQAMAIANAIKSVFQSVPFPYNLILAGVAVAGVAALFSRVRLGEGGLVTRPTTALIGEKGPELVIPLKKLGLLGAGAQGQGVTLQQTLHFHGNINSSYSVDEISRILGERTMQAIEKGRRF